MSSRRTWDGLQEPETGEEAETGPGANAGARSKTVSCSCSRRRIKEKNALFCKSVSIY